MSRFILALATLTLSMNALAVSSSAAKLTQTASRKVANEGLKCSTGSGETPGIDPAYVDSQVKASVNCNQASHIAEHCATGGASDAGIMSHAIEVCDVKTGKLSKSDAELKSTLNSRCAKICSASSDGAICISQLALCHLVVSRLMNMVTEAPKP